MRSCETGQSITETVDIADSGKTRLVPILGKFNIAIQDPARIQVETIHRGLISSVFRVTVEADQTQFILRQINPIFDIHALDTNLQLYQQAQSMTTGELPAYWQRIVFFPVSGSDQIIYSKVFG